MSSYSLSHLSDGTLLRDLSAHLASERASTALVLAHLAEVDARRLYLPAGYPSMFAYCVDELHLCEQAAFRRIRAARAARQFPAIFDAVADGRLHLSAITLLAPYLTEENAGELLAAAAHRTRAQIEHLLAERFPRPDAPTQIQPLSMAPPAIELASMRVGVPCELAPMRVEAPGALASMRVEAPAPRPRVAPLSPGRYALQVTIPQHTQDKLRHAQALLGHAVPAGDVAEVLDRALDALIHKLERRKLGAAEKPQPQRGASARARHIPAHIRRAVWERDGGQCTFVSDSGHRCTARTRLEFDHVEPVARGGQATMEGMRLRCRAHNQYTAELTYGAEFMERKREDARRAAAERTAAEASHDRVRERPRAGAGYSPWRGGGPVRRPLGPHGPSQHWVERRSPYRDPPR